MAISMQEAVALFQQGVQKTQNEMATLNLAQQIMQAQSQRIQQLEEQLKQSNIVPMTSPTVASVEG